MRVELVLQVEDEVPRTELLVLPRSGRVDLGEERARKQRLAEVDREGPGHHLDGALHHPPADRRRAEPHDVPGRRRRDRGHVVHGRRSRSTTPETAVGLCATPAETRWRRRRPGWWRRRTGRARPAGAGSRTGRRAPRRSGRAGSRGRSGREAGAAGSGRRCRPRARCASSRLVHDAPDAHAHADGVAADDRLSLRDRVRPT